MNDELKKAAAKIAKCLALAASDNPAEAEAAKRQAEALMKKYNLNGEQVAAAQVTEQQSKTGGKHRPPLYFCQLAAIVADAFACEAIASPGGGYKESCMIFIGLGCKPELAGYTFDVLRRQLNKDRTSYQATLKRYKRENKSRIAKQVREFAGSDQEKQAVTAYKAQRWGDSLETDQRAGAKPEKNNDWDAIDKGHQAARDVSLHKPVQSKLRTLLNQQP
jgi:hypothetical protein